MTVTCTNTKHIYPGDGQRRKWPFTFPLFNAAHLRLWRVGADGKAVLKTAGFYVDMEEKEVLYPLENEQEPVPAAGEYIVLQRVTPLTQEFDVKRSKTWTCKPGKTRTTWPSCVSRNWRRNFPARLNFPCKTKTQIRTRPAIWPPLPN